jgi:hypothetical protein
MSLGKIPPTQYKPPQIFHFTPLHFVLFTYHTEILQLWTQRLFLCPSLTANNSCWRSAFVLHHKHCVAQGTASGPGGQPRTSSYYVLNRSGSAFASERPSNAKAARKQAYTKQQKAPKKLRGLRETTIPTEWPPLVGEVKDGRRPKHVMAVIITTRGTTGAKTDTLIYQ